MLFTWDTWEDEEGVQGDAGDHRKGVEKELMKKIKTKINQSKLE